MLKMNLTDNRILRLGTLCSLYLAQGIPFGFVVYTLAAYLAGKGLVENDIGNIVAWSTLPWAFKWIWGPIVDRIGLPAMGHRRPWILLAQFMMILTIAAMVAIPDLTTSIGLLCVMIFIHNIFNALQDVSVDALAVDLLPEKERGKANGLMYGAKCLGTMIGAVGLMKINSLYGMRTTLCAQAAMLAIIMLIPLLLRERTGEKLLPWTKGKTMAPSHEQSFQSTRQLFSVLLKAFSLRSTILTALLALFINMGIGVLSVASTVLVVRHLGWTAEEWINFIGFWGVLTGVAGSVMGGFIADKFGHRKILAITAVLLALAWFVLSCTTSWWPNKSYIMVVTLFETFIMAVMTVSFFSLAMGVSWPKVAATQFTAYMALMNLSTTIGAKLSGILKSLMLDIFPSSAHATQIALDPNQPSIGYDPNQVSNTFGIPDALMAYAGLYFCVGLLQLSMLLLLPFIDPHQTRKVLGSDTNEKS